jgi:hypothetical protein
MKSPQKNEATTTKPSNGVEVLSQIAKLALSYRGTAKPNLAEIGRIVGRASGLLKIADQDEKFEIENRALADQISRRGNVESVVPIRSRSVASIV